MIHLKFSHIYQKKKVYQEVKLIFYECLKLVIFFTLKLTNSHTTIFLVCCYSKILFVGTIGSLNFHQMFALSFSIHNNIFEIF